MDACAPTLMLPSLTTRHTASSGGRFPIKVKLLLRGADERGINQLASGITSSQELSRSNWALCQTPNTTGVWPRTIDQCGPAAPCPRLPPGHLAAWAPPPPPPPPWSQRGRSPLRGIYG